MVSDAERMARAGEYVLGRMKGPERERAERDLETDARFRAAVLAVAERMRYFGSGRDNPQKAASAEAAWAELKQRLAALPQMQGTNISEVLVSRSPAVLLDGGEARRQPRQGRKLSWRRVYGALLVLLRRSLRRPGPPRAAAVLQTPQKVPAATLELLADNSFRLLLLEEFLLRPDEQLALWGQRDDGTADRVGGFRPRGQLRIKGQPGPACYLSFSLARERVSLVPPGRMAGPALAAGPLKPLSNSMSERAALPLPDAGRAVTR